MDAEFITEKIIAATNEVFETMLFMAVEPSEPLGDGQIKDRIDFSAYIGISGKINGIVGVHCRVALVEAITSTLTESESEDELIDAWAEIVNMVAGNLKTHISSQVDTFELSVPTVIAGHEFRIVNRGSKSSFPRIILPFVADDEYVFYVDVLYCNQ